MNALYVLWLRQIKKHIRSKSRMIGSLGQPLLFLLAFGFGFGPIFAKAGSGNYILFARKQPIGLISKYQTRILELETKLNIKLLPLFKQIERIDSKKTLTPVGILV